MQRGTRFAASPDSLAWERWPGERLFTYVDPNKVRSFNPGYCFLRAGWDRCPERARKQLPRPGQPQPSRQCTFLRLCPLWLGAV